MRVLVAGASGFIGQAAVRRLRADGHAVVALSRGPQRHAWPEGVESVAWDAASTPNVAGPVDAVVNLAGESVGQRWTEPVKQRMRASRVGVADHLVDWMAALPADKRPRVVVSASGVGYYGLAPAGPQREDAPPGNDLLALLCRDWEDAAQHTEMLGARVVVFRFGVVLHPAGGALARLLPPFRLGFGGPIGKGTQPFPWVHREDVAAAIAWAIATSQAAGAYNLVAPEQVDMGAFAKALGAALHRPAVMRVPAFALRALLGKGAAEVVLGGQLAPSDRIRAAGFRFQHPDLAPALQEMLASKAT